VKSFQALQAPFLVTNYALLDRVLTSPIANEMLAGLKRQDVVGIALLPGLLRHPVGLRRVLVSPARFRRARVRIQPSKATRALMTALGAKPVGVGNSSVVAAISHRRIDGEELSLANAPGGSTRTANVTFFAKAPTLFASRVAYEQLSHAQRKVLREAAKQTLRHVVARRRARWHAPSAATTGRSCWRQSASPPSSRGRRDRTMRSWNATGRRGYSSRESAN
jgi:TRAP-type C4-dicarboxylate transport system substrate-binding protein